MSEDFRSLAGGPEQDAAYRIIVERAAWLRSIGSTQWLRPLSRDVFDARHERGENYGYFRDGALVGGVALIRGYRPGYLEERELLPAEDYFWLASLVTSVAAKGQGFGRRILERSEEAVLRAGVDLICLDCNRAGPLPAFYEASGYGERGRVEMESQGRVLRIALYEKRLAKRERIG